MKTDTGGAAFPTAITAESGMTLLDYYAGQADIPWSAIIETLEKKGNKCPTISDVLQARAEMSFMEAEFKIAEKHRREQ